MHKTLIYIGLILIIAGLFWPWIVKLPIGRLPGDIVVERPGFKIYIPVTTMILASLLISLICWLLRK